MDRSWVIIIIVKSNMKSEQEIEFEQTLKSLDMDFQIFENPKSSAKLTQNRLVELEGMLKNLKKVYDRM